MAECSKCGGKSRPKFPHDPDVCPHCFGTGLEPLEIRECHRTAAAIATALADVELEACQVTEWDEMAGTDEPKGIVARIRYLRRVRREEREELGAEIIRLKRVISLYNPCDYACDDLPEGSPMPKAPKIPTVDDAEETKND